MISSTISYSNKNLCEKWILGFDAVSRRILPLLLPLDYFIFCHLPLFPYFHVKSDCIIHLFLLLLIVIFATYCQPQSSLFESDSSLHSLFICHFIVADEKVKLCHFQWVDSLNCFLLLFATCFDCWMPHQNTV